MAKFCTQCGNPIEFCVCPKEATEQPAPAAPPINPYQPTPQPPIGGYNPNPQPPVNHYNPVPQPPTNGYNPVPTPPVPPATGTSQGPVVKINTDSEAFISLKNFFGFGESEQIDNSDPFERGKRIVPDLVEPCEGEVPVKQYEIGKCRSRLKLQWAEARLQITNKRVLFRVSGRSAIGKDVSCYDYDIDQISGINFSKGIQISFVTLLLSLLIVSVFTGIGMGFGYLIESASVVLGIIFTIASIAAWIAFPLLLHKRLHLPCAMIAAFSSGMCVAGTSEESFMMVFLAISALITLIKLFKSALKPSATIEIVTKDSAKEVFGMFPGRLFKSTHASEVVPSIDTDEAFKEISAVISDIQKLGDYGIEKWKEDKAETAAVN